MPLFRDYHPEQSQLFGYVDPDTQLPEDDPARFVDELVEQLDLNVLEKRYSSKGSKGYDPRLHLKVFLLGYMEGVFSSRNLMHRCQRDLGFIYLCRGQVPDFRTIARFRKTHREDLKVVFEQVVRLARGMGMGKLGRLVIDGTTMKANASRNASIKADELEEELKDLEDYIKKMSENDDDDDDRFGGGRTGKELPEGLATEKERKKKIRKALEKQQRLRDAKQQMEQIKRNAGNRTDPDCNFRRDGITRRSVPGYGCHAMTSEDDLIIDARVENIANDRDVLPVALEQARKTVGDNLKGSELYADSGFYSVENIEELQRARIHPVIPDQVSVRRMMGKTIGTKIRPGFRYHKGTDSFIYPAGEHLYFDKMEQEVRQGHRRTRRVYINPVACDDCCVRKDCCGEKFPYKKLRVTGRPDQVAEYLSQFTGPESRPKYRFRQRIEKFFGHVKGNKRFRQFLCRGLETVTAEWLLICTAYNIQRMKRACSS